MQRLEKALYSTLNVNKDNIGNIVDNNNNNKNNNNNSNNNENNNVYTGKSYKRAR